MLIYALFTGVFSFAYSGSDEKDSEGSRKVGPAAVRGRLESRMDSYLRVESFLADGTVAEGDDGQCLGKVSYGRRLRDMLVACIFLGLGFGAMFSAPGCFFHCFALAHSVLLVVSYLFDFFFVRRGVRLEPGVISGGVTRAGVVAFAVMSRIRPAALPESGSWHSPSPPSGWRGAPPAGARDKTPVDAYVPARPSRRGSATTPNPATHFSPAVP